MDRRQFTIGATAMIAATASASGSAPLIETKDIRGDRPAFEREYTSTLGPNRIRLKINIKWFIGDIFKSGELRQPNGAWVMFDPENPADKILDRELLPMVQAACRQILHDDRLFRSGNPSVYTDETGAHWKRI